MGYLYFLFILVFIFFIGTTVYHIYNIHWGRPAKTKNTLFIITAAFVMLIVLIYIMVGKDNESKQGYVNKGDIEELVEIEEELKDYKFGFE